MSAPATMPVWRLEALTPLAVVGDGDATVEAWRVLETWAPRRDWRGAAAEAFLSLVDPLPSGTCLRVVSPKGAAGPVRVVGPDGVPRQVRFDGYLYDASASLGALRADPVAWWRGCANGRYLLCVAGHLAPQGSPLRRAAVRAACACARLSLPLFEARYPNDTRPRAAIETAERWSYGEATLDEVRTAREAAWDACRSAAAASAASFASAASASFASASSAASAASFASASSAADAASFASASSASSAASAASASSAFDSERERQVLAECADLTRRHVPLREVLIALVGGVR